VPEPEPGFSDLLGGDTVIIALELIVGVRLLCYTKIQSSAGFKKKRQRSWWKNAADGRYSLLDGSFLGKNL